MTVSRNLGNTAGLLLASAVIAIALGCGNGGVGVGGTGGETLGTIVVTPPPVSAGVPVLSIGSISGFGSVIVNGIRFDDTKAVVSREASTSTSTSLRLGMTVQVMGSVAPDGLTGIAETIKVFSEVKGLVTAIDLPANTIVLLGTTIRLSASTVVDGVMQLSAIKVGDKIEAFGLRNIATGELSATRLEIEPSSTTVSGPLAVSIKGAVTNLNTGNKTFKINNQLVDYTNAAVMGTLANTVSVQVQGTISSNVATLNASKVEADTLSAPMGVRLEVQGSVSSFVSASDFKLNGVAVNASAVTLSALQLARLVNGAVCEAAGLVENAILKATKLECESIGQTASFEVKGAISAFVSVANFTVRGQVIDASTATFDGGTAANLAVGKIVEIKGPVVNGILKASKVSF
jgi:hypothetical protein